MKDSYGDNYYSYRGYQIRKTNDRQTEVYGCPWFIVKKGDHDPENGFYRSHFPTIRDAKESIDISLEPWPGD